MEGGRCCWPLKYMTNLTLPTSSPAKPATKSATEIAEEMLGEIDWISPTEGHCDCPGKHRHSNRSGRRDCAVYLDHVPTIHCVHQSCSSIIEATNKKLRSATLNGAKVEKRNIAEDKAARKAREEKERLRLRAAKSLPQMLVEFAWPYDQIISDSPVKIVENESDHWKMLLNQFSPDEVLWIGDKFDSGKPEHACHFKSATDWMKSKAAPGPFICPCTFKNTSQARSNENIVARRFLVVESDTLSRNEVGAVFRWLKDGCDLKLVAIVDTGGKSLHAWFEFEEDLLDTQKLVLPALQCDPKLFTPSQPVRLPGKMRETGRYQKLVYLARKVSHE